MAVRKLFVISALLVALLVVGIAYAMPQDWNSNSGENNQRAKCQKAGGWCLSYHDCCFGACKSAISQSQLFIEVVHSNFSKPIKYSFVFNRFLYDMH